MHIFARVLAQLLANQHLHNWCCLLLTVRLRESSVPRIVCCVWFVFSVTLFPCESLRWLHKHNISSTHKHETHINFDVNIFMFGVLYATYSFHVNLEFPK